MGPPLLDGSQYQEILIPCKPTSKMWEVQLIKEGDEVTQMLLLLNAFKKNRVFLMSPKSLIDLCLNIFDRLTCFYVKKKK